MLCAPPHGLFRQSWAPRNQAYGTVNADGFGVGWYADGDPVPARYRRAGPIWADPSFADIARVVSSAAVLAAVRSATPGQAAGDAAAAPFAEGEWLFSHNGCLFDWPASGRAVAEVVPSSALLDVEVLTDSGVLWALVRHGLVSGVPAEQAVADAVHQVRKVADGRLNLMLTDGRRVVATADGDTLVYRQLSRRHGPHTQAPQAHALDEVLVCSEPVDDEDGWVSVPDGSMLVASRDRVEVTPLAVTGSADGAARHIHRAETP